MKNGFTVLEFLIYIVILAIALAGMILASSNIFQVGTITEVYQEVSHNGSFAVHKIGQSVKEASGISIKEGGKVLELSFKDKNPTVFDVFDGKLRIKDGNSDYVDLTTNKVRVESLLFDKISDYSVRVEMHVSFSNPQNLPQYDFKSYFTSSFTLKN